MPEKVSAKKTSTAKKSIPAKKPVKKPVTFTRSAEKKESKPAAAIPEKKTTGSEETVVKPRSIKLHKMTVIIALLIILAGVLLYYGRGFFVAAVVNGQPITRFELANEAEKASGKQVLSSLVRTALVEQEARKLNISVNDNEVNDQIKDIEKNLSSQGQDINKMLELQGMTREDLRKIVTLDLLVTKVVGKDIKVSDKQVDEYIKENKDLLPKDKKGAELKKFASEQIKKSQLAPKAQTWFAELEKKSNIIKFVNY